MIWLEVVGSGSSSSMDPHSSSSFHSTGGGALFLDGGLSLIFFLFSLGFLTGDTQVASLTTAGIFLVLDATRVAEKRKPADSFAFRIRS